jgi:hypothetical protein
MDRLRAFPRIRLQTPGKDWRLFPGLAAFCPGLFSSRAYEMLNTAKPATQFNEMPTECDVAWPGDWGRRDNSIIGAEGATKCLLKHNFRVAG